MADIAFFVGALIGSFLVSRFVRALLFRRATGVTKVYGPNLTTLGIATVAAAFGFADDLRLPQFGRAFLSYLLPVVICVFYDVIRESKTSGER